MTSSEPKYCAATSRNSSGLITFRLICSGTADTEKICSEPAVARRAHIEAAIIRPFITAAKIQLRKRSEDTAPADVGPTPSDVLTTVESDTEEAEAESDTAPDAEGESPVADSKHDAEDTKVLSEAQQVAAETEVEGPSGPNEGKEPAEQTLQAEAAEPQVADPDSTLPNEDAATKGSLLSVRAWVLVGQVFLSSFISHEVHLRPLRFTEALPALTLGDTVSGVT